MLCIGVGGCIRLSRQALLSLLYITAAATGEVGIQNIGGFPMS
jgi:hypothetical protein